MDNHVRIPKRYSVGMPSEPPSPARMPPDLVWTFAGSEVSGWQREGDALLIRLAVAAAQGTLDAQTGPVDANLIPLLVRCDAVANWPVAAEHPRALSEGALHDGTAVRRMLPVPGRIDAAGSGNLLTLTLAWRQGGSLVVRCRSVALLLLPDSRLIESWAC